MKEEKYIKDKLSNYDSPMDMDAMWAELEDSMDKNTDEKPVFWLFRFGKKIFFSSILLLIAISAFSYYYWNTHNTITKNTYSQLDNTNTTPSATERKATDLSKGITAGSIENETINEEEASTADLRTRNKNNSGVPEIREKISDETKTTNINSKTKAQKRNRPTSSGQAKSSQAIIKKQQASPPLLVNQTPTSNTYMAKTKMSNKTASLSTEKKPPLLTAISLLANSQLLTLDNTAPTLEMTMAENPVEVIRVRRPHKKWRASLGIAQSATLFQHAITDAEIVSFRSRNGETSTTNNWSMGVGLERVTKRGWLFSTGLNYINHGAIYSARDGRESIELEFSPIVYVDSQSNFLGEGEELTEILVIRRKAFRQYKRLHSMQLPLLVGFEKRLSKIDFSLSAGPACNYFFSQSANDVRETEALLNYKLSTMKISGQLKAQVGYSLNEKVRLYTSVEYGSLLGTLKSGNEDVEFLQVAESNYNYGRVSMGLSYAF